MSTLSNRIRELRTEKELTQEEFGKLFGIVKSTVSLYESGKSAPDDEIKKKIAKYFNVSLDYLMGVSDVKNPYINDKDLDEVDKFLLELKKEAEKEGLEFDETSPQELIETYKLLKEFKKRTKGD
ncbi:helix-turn-helix domain-containing protein [Sporanaerobacter acetigenes]|uniref:DNA-binding transcriptional regulator, XRE-family HTH domain n=1 Tax=Sporanaerobacter acetigenes DSM 13106 TaxID=1123281 RepID=A0A1M5U4C3_9FIRM|nr:helix-turn-helix transcriptional regulator [Sporanaerobacter acetigenes]SHH57819.1 DNA-binding transcriptional regulator, XRE-family HTH domain [Sporanaerobacter acetigenes DSM 13106]